MKNFKTVLLPAVLMLVGAGSAYATKIVKQDAKLPSVGYAYHPGELVECVPSDKTCDTSGNVICTADVGRGTEEMHEWNGTVCQDKLFEPIVK